MFTFTTEANLTDIFDKMQPKDLTLILIWISNYNHYNMWDEIIYPFPNFNSVTVEV